MTTLFALFAEVERDLISERTREGLAGARASGRKLGRPKAKGSLGVYTARRQGGRDSALPRAGRLQDRHCQGRAAPRQSAQDQSRSTLPPDTL